MNVSIIIIIIIIIIHNVTGDKTTPKFLMRLTGCTMPLYSLVSTNAKRPQHDNINCKYTFNYFYPTFNVTV